MPEPPDPRKDALADQVTADLVVIAAKQAQLDDLTDAERSKPSQADAAVQTADGVRAQVQALADQKAAADQTLAEKRARLDALRAHRDALRAQVRS